MVNSEQKPEKPIIIYRQIYRNGLTTGIVGCIFGLLAIFSIGILFLPFAILFSIVSLFASTSRLNGPGISASVISIILTIMGFAYSPTAWLVLAGLLAANAPTIGQQPSRHTATSSPATGSLDLLQAVPLGRQQPSPMSPMAPPSVMSPAYNVGPTYNCAKAIDTLAQIICADAELRRADVEMTQPYYALRHAFPGEIQRLRQDAVSFQQNTIIDCSVPQRISLSPELVSTRRGCLLAAYQRQRSVWLDELKQRAPSALVEVDRSASEHVVLQIKLKEQGFLPAEAEIDGAYGNGTRAAIQRAQSRYGFEITGFAGDDLAERLGRPMRSQ